MFGKRLLAPLLTFVTLVVPASASAHPKSATVALDYRLILDHATRALPNGSGGPAHQGRNGLAPHWGLDVHMA